eukprot:GEZU01023286.1.p1 GENE.GEZU01023286.1~~GEZU01023286.1.p1  ORF type:complete len:303 (-),score=31.35 GEZU01023286.1:55-963(-)
MQSRLLWNPTIRILWQPPPRRIHNTKSLQLIQVTLNAILTIIPIYTLSMKCVNSSFYTLSIPIIFLSLPVINNQLVHGHVTTLSNPIGHYNIMPSPHGCPGALQVSTSASYYGCEVAYNAGFFDLITQTCIGNIISNGKVVQMQSTNYNGVQFGTTASGDYVIGYLNNTEIENLKLTNLVGGNMWLVRNGASYIDTAISIERPGYDFIWEKAPRNAIGFNAKGELLLIEVDGDEALHFGLDLYEFTQVVLSTGVLYALNMDGGGSTTAYVNGTVINQPSDFCPDGINRCERFVTTISCIKNF